MTEQLFMLFAFGLAVAVIVWLFVVTGQMARRRGHSPWPWWIVGVFTSPLVSIVILWVFFRVSDDTVARGGGEMR